MKTLSSILALGSTVAALNCTNGTLQQDFDERFAVYTAKDGCEYVGCSEDLTHPVDGLSWTNVQSVFHVTPVDFIHPGGQLPPYVFSSSGASGGPQGVWVGAAINATVPTTATSKYNGSCVRDWELNMLALGCNIYTKGAGPGPRDCNITVEGFDSKGQCVGHEKFSYHGEVINTGFPPYWLETNYNTTAGGLKGQKLQKISILADVPYDPATEDTPELGIGEMLYTVFNSTSKCGCPSGGSNATFQAR